MFWVNVLHFYQPSWQTKKIVDKVVDEAYQPILNILEKNPYIKITLNVSASLVEHFNNFGYNHILNQIKFLAEKGQIEFLGSAKYHPILPLLPQKEAIRQIKLNEETCSKHFGKFWQPRPYGFFLPELAYNKKTAQIIDKLGYKYIILDEISYNGKIGQDIFNNNWRIDKLNLLVIFRHRILSNVFFDKDLRDEAKFWSVLKEDGRSKNILITAFDGENLGHHFKKRDEIWAKLLLNPKIKILLGKESFSLFKKEKTVEPLSSSWSSTEEQLQNNIPYGLWKHPENIIHQYQWQLTELALKAIKLGRGNSNFKSARLLDEALSSDGYWWASANPWWNPHIVFRSVDLFLKIFTLLKKDLPVSYFNQAQTIKNKIDQEIDKCLKSGRCIMTKSIGEK